MQVKANPDGESFVIFNNGEATAADGMTGAFSPLCLARGRELRPDALVKCRTTL